MPVEGESFDTEMPDVDFDASVALSVACDANLQVDEKLSAELDSQGQQQRPASPPIPSAVSIPEDAPAPGTPTPLPHDSSAVLAASPPPSQNIPEFATPTQQPRNFRGMLIAAQSQAMYGHGQIPPSPVIAPGALHELGDFMRTPSRRRSSAVGGIAGLEELRNRLEETNETDHSRLNQLIRATKFIGEDAASLVDAFLRLDFEDGPVSITVLPSGPTCE